VIDDSLSSHRGEQLDSLLRLAATTRDPTHLSLLCRATNALTALCYAEVCAAWYEALPAGYVADETVRREEYLGRLLAASEVPVRRARWKRLRAELCEALGRGGGDVHSDAHGDAAPPRALTTAKHLAHAVCGSPAEVVAEWDRLAEEERRGAS